MTAIPIPADASTLDDHPSSHAHDHSHAHPKMSFVKKYIFSTDHKVIGLQFLFVGLLFMVVGGLLAMLVRWQLAWPNDRIPGGVKYVPILSEWLWDGTPGHPKAMPADWYNVAFTMHASIMIFLVVIPLLVGTFGNYLIPLKIGAPDMAFPFLNGAAFWLSVPAGMLLVASFFFPGNAAQAGWTSYPTLSAVQSGKPMVPLDGMPTDRLGWAVYYLQNREAGAAIMGKPENAAADQVAGYFGESSLLLDAIAESAARKQMAVTRTADGLSVTRTGENAGKVDLRVVPGEQRDEKGKFLNGAITASGDAKLTSDVLTQAKDWINSNQLFPRRSPWPTFSLFTVLGGLFFCFLYLAAYQVRLGFRPLNWLVGIVVSAIAAYGGLKLFQFLAFDGQSAWFFAIFLIGFSSILGAVNYLTTIVKLRAPGMTFFRMPLSVWSLFVTSLIVLLATPVLAASLFMNLLDHHRWTSFFLPFNWTLSGQIQPDAAGGGFPILHQHLFWFYSHPAVYIMILPAMGMVSDVLSVFSRKPIFGYRPMIYAMATIAFLGFIVWAHHMFQSGMNPTLASGFAISTMLIAVPSAIKTFNWLGTLSRGNIQFTTPMLHAITFVAMFVIGGLSGIFMASTAVDVHIHDTYFIVAHIHYVLFGGSLFGIFAAITFWYPKMFGRMLSEKVGKLHWLLTFLGFNGAFFPMHILGMRGMARRVADYTQYPSFADLLAMNQFITWSALIMGAAQVLFALNFIGSWVLGRKAGRNPWKATTLEWETASPPPHGNFEQTPVVYHGPYEYSSPLVEEDYLLQTRKVEMPAGYASAAH